MTRPSNVAWAALTVGVAFYEYCAPEGELMSQAVDRALEKPLGRYLALGAIAITAAHLANILPEQYDPIHQLGRIAR